MAASRFDAFISYNHAADGDLAPAIERGLERIAKPWYRLRGMSVVRDLSDTGAISDLSGTVERQLDASAYLILLASPGSAASKWVEREATYWCDTKSSETVIVVLTGGALHWDHATKRFLPTSDALAPSVAARFTSEPAFVDMTWARQAGDLSLRNTVFREHIARIASPIKGKAPADIESEDIRLHRRAKRLARSAVAVVVTLAIVASIAAVLAVANARRAERRAREAVARQLGLAALDMPASELDEALLLSAAATELDPSDSVDQFRTSRTLLGRHARLTAMMHLGTHDDTSVRSVAISPDESTFAAMVDTLAAPPEVLTWSLDEPTSPTRAALTAESGMDLAFVSGGDATTNLLTAASTGRRLTSIAADGSVAAAFDGVVVDTHKWDHTAL
ncbi:MAG TPA: toll/interleukin-1 receptor domain-containing protein, partial [Ilumatobacteraceae bacterium]